MFDEMNMPPENEPQEARWEGWTPPWMANEEQGPRGPFGPGRGFGPRGPRGPFGFGGPRGPFGRGFGRFGGPQEWQQGPQGPQGAHGPFGHGHGPGHGHHEHGWGRRGWQGPRGPFGRGFGPGFGPWQGVPDELLALRVEAAEVARLFAIASRGAFENKERLAELRTFLDRSHKELSDMIFGSAQSQPTSESQNPGNTPDVGQA